MDVNEARCALEKGERITRKEWLVEDFLFMEHGLIKDDGGNVWPLEEFEKAGRSGWLTKPSSELNARLDTLTRE